MKENMETMSLSFVNKTIKTTMWW